MSEWTDSMRARLDEMKAAAARPRISVSGISMVIGLLSALGGLASLYVSNERTDAAQSTRLEFLESQVLRDRAEWRDEVRSLRGELSSGFARIEAKVEARRDVSAR